MLSFSSPAFPSAWGWVENDWILILGWTYPLSILHIRKWGQRYWHKATPLKTSLLRPHKQNKSKAQINTVHIKCNCLCESSESKTVHFQFSCEAEVYILLTSPSSHPTTWTLRSFTQTLLFTIQAQLQGWSNIFHCCLQLWNIFPLAVRFSLTLILNPD